MVYIVLFKDTNFTTIKTFKTLIKHNKKIIELKIITDKHNYKYMNTGILKSLFCKQTINLWAREIRLCTNQSVSVHLFILNPTYNHRITLFACLYT